MFCIFNYCPYKIFHFSYRIYGARITAGKSMYHTFTFSNIHCLHLFFTPQQKVSVAAQPYHFRLLMISVFGGNK